MTEVPSSTDEEPLSFYAMTQAINETKACSKSASPLNPRPVYAVVTKAKKKDKVMESDGANDIMNDVVKMDSGDVIMCENTDLYDATTDDEGNMSEENEHAIAGRSRNCVESKSKYEKDYENISAKENLERNGNKDDNNSSALNKDSTLYSDTINIFGRKSFENNRPCRHNNVDENGKDMTDVVYENIFDSKEKPGQGALLSDNKRQSLA